MVSISGIVGGFNTVRTYGNKILKVMPELAFGTSSEAIGKEMKGASGSVFQKAEAGWRKLNQITDDNIKNNGNFFKSFWKNCKNFFPDIKKAYQAGAKDGVWKGVKGVFKNFGKKMPFIMSAIMILTELPNVIKATKEKGIFQGGKEILKFGARMAGAGAGAAIGTALIPIPWVGSLVGWTVGEWLTSKIVGKSYTEQQAEKEQVIQEAMGMPQSTQQQVQQPTLQPQQPNPYWLNTNKNGQVAFSGMSNPYNMSQIQNVPYSDDIMMKKMPFNVVA